MVEQPHSGERHDHVVVIALGDHQVVPDGAAGLGNVPHAGAPRPLDVVREGEESVAAQGYASYSPEECPMCRQGQKLDAAVDKYGYSTL